ncbi:hypothetical protein [Streptomyces sp. A0592]|uniref:hypothetical protein n=1 Tax=Streptomyces sp. A0592 TaxID=2563099 RepID=UPI00109E9F15|nr:hypothetical protein [Streptomyces sp. A0592]THA82707.1 hypothetical protein E6U81_19370 [Streptomyces sp. A0592]
MPDSCRLRLNPTQQTRYDADARALAQSRIADLATLGAASSIVMIESLRSSLDDALQLIGELIDKT